MRKLFTIALRTGCIAALALLVGVGCGRSAANQDQRDNRDPLLQRARVKEKANDIDGAAELFEKALERKPGLARAHLELGLLLDKHKEDYLGAIYHYQRYIDMRPDAEKRDLIEGLIAQARLSYAASLPDRPSGAIKAIHDLQQEVSKLRARLAEYESAGRPPASREGAVRPAVAATPEDRGIPQPAPAQAAVRTYQVQRGDTLSRIASKMYNDARKWKKIYEANRTILSSPESLKLGQTLVIPP